MADKKTSPAGKTGAGKTGAGKTGAGKTGAGKTGAGKTGAGKTGAGKTDLGKMVTVEQIASPIRRPKDQRATLIGLGLNKIRRRRTLKDTPEVRGMINKIPHLVRVVDDK